MEITARIDGPKIKAARLAAGMTQAQLARALGTTERNIARWEKPFGAPGAHQPRGGTVMAIAKATGKEPEFFLAGDEPSDDDDDPETQSIEDALRGVVRRLVREEREAAAGVR